VELMAKKRGYGKGKEWEGVGAVVAKLT